MTHTDVKVMAGQVFRTNSLEIFELASSSIRQAIKSIINADQKSETGGHCLGKAKKSSDNFKVMKSCLFG